MLLLPSSVALKIDGSLFMVDSVLVSDMYVTTAGSSLISIVWKPLSLCQCHKRGIQIL